MGPVCSCVETTVMRYTLVVNANWILYHIKKDWKDGLNKYLNSLLIASASQQQYHSPSFSASILLYISFQSPASPILPFPPFHINSNSSKWTGGKEQHFKQQPQSQQVLGNSIYWNKRASHFNVISCRMCEASLVEFPWLATGVGEDDYNLV